MTDTQKTTDPQSAPAPDRRVELSIDITADRDAVWRAISNGDELKRWFPLDARIDAPDGASDDAGKIWLSWGPGCEGEAPLSVWQDGERIAWTESYGETTRLVVEFLVESDEGSGRTKVRMVQSGFGIDSNWDDYFDTVHSGWGYFLWNLRHYLERHPRKSRDMVWTRRKAGLGRNALWSALLGDGGLIVAAPGTEPVEAATAQGKAFRLWTGDEGTFHSITDGTHISGVVPSLDDALVFFEIEMGDEPTLGVWLSTYGLAADRVEALQTSLDAAFDAAFPAAA